jgi:hypothetical protein
MPLTPPPPHTTQIFRGRRIDACVSRRRRRRHGADARNVGWVGGWVCVVVVVVVAEGRLALDLLLLLLMLFFFRRCDSAGWRADMCVWGVRDHGILPRHGGPVKFFF